MTEALAAIRFGDGFVNCVQLFYSHATPPTRQMAINGRLGTSFPLASGVAQGCPLSPLLFIIVTEALTRLINSDTRIEGVCIHHGPSYSTHHKLSQQSTLPSSRAARATCDTCRATYSSGATPQA